MRRGDFAAAWEISDVALRARVGTPCWHWPRHLQHVWDGSPLAGKRVLVRCYHGLGDTVQFIRFLPQLKAVASETIVWAQPVLLPLLHGMRGVDRLLPLHDGTPDCEYDADVELMELPHAFRTTLETLPADIPYLPGAPRVRATSEEEISVGLVWRAGDWDERRSIPTRLLEPLTRVSGVRLQVIQQGPVRAEWPDGWGVKSGADRVEELAACLQGLDLLISVDSFPAHLAGALGVPVWLLLHAKPDWRWLSAREDSPWYPTMRLFRQQRVGDWAEVIARVARELRGTLRSADRGLRIL